MNRPRIVIIGCGFGGIALAKALRTAPVEVLLLDRNNYHTFQPLLYQVATGGLEPDSIAYPVRRIFRGYANVRFQMATVQSVIPERNVLQTSIGEVEYDRLVIATGSTNNFFSFEVVNNRLLPLKSVTDALNIRSYLMQNLEKAILTQHTLERNELINIAIIGGGPAGIELAGALAEMRRYVLPKDFPEIDFSMMSITLFEAAPKLLGAMSELASRKSLEYLKKLGVNVLLNAKVKEIKNRRVYLEDGSTFQTDTVIWTAGVKGNPLPGLPAESILPGNRISVDVFNKVKGLENVYAIGDVAACMDELAPKGMPMLAPVAIQQAQRLARNWQLDMKDRPMVPFIYKNKGVMATVGRNKAVADLPRKKFKGRFAWFIWMFVHIFSLVGFRNRVVTFVDWLFNYINYDRPLGLIIRPFTRPIDATEIINTESKQETPVK